MNDPLITALGELRTTAPAPAVAAALVASGAVDGYVTRPTAIGTIYVAFGGEGVTAVGMADSPDAFEERYATDHGRDVVEVLQAPVRIERHLDRAIEAGRPGPLPVDLAGLTEFQQAVLRKTAEIPNGEIRPYGWVAKEIGRPGAVRAVGTALAKNPVPLVIPCHRVVRSDGRLGDYSLGDPENKRILLEGEGLDIADLERLARRGVRFVGSDTTQVFCHPTCRPATSISDPHRVEFRSAAEAIDAGYRPCKVCRPATSAA